MSLRRFFIYGEQLFTIINSETTPEGKLCVEIEAEEIGDSYHSMHELYQHRMALNIALFQSWYTMSLNFTEFPIKVFKSLLHSDGTMFDGYFIVIAITPQGQISYHYKMKHWDKFMLPEIDRAPDYDGHSALDVMERLMEVVK